jgi:hypothetical protein
MDLIELEYRRSLSLRVLTIGLEIRLLNYRVIIRTFRDVKTNEGKEDLHKRVYHRHCSHNTR